jgi:hypothetical protein
VSGALNRINDLVLGLIALTQPTTLQEASDALGRQASLPSSISRRVFGGDLQVGAEQMINNLTAKSLGCVVRKAPT